MKDAARDFVLSRKKRARNESVRACVHRMQFCPDKRIFSVRCTGMNALSLF